MSVDVEVLIHDHKKAVSTIDGLEFHTAPALLAQLRDAVFGGGVADGAGNSMKAKLPIQAAALDLYMLIDRQITEAWVAAFNRPPNADRIETLLAEWAAWAQDETLVTVANRDVYARDAASGWVAAIEDYLNPPRLAEISAPCPTCEVENIYRHQDGEEVRTTALSFVRDRQTGETLRAECRACGVQWQPSQFEFLANMIGLKWVR